MKYLLDTDICIFFLQGKYKIKDRIKKVGVENCYISEITLAELKYGVANSSNRIKHLGEVEKMEALFTVLPIYNALDEFANEKSRLKKNGILISDFDLLIGVTSITNNLIMVTNNVKHLQRIKQIKIENWKEMAL